MKLSNELKKVVKRFLIGIAASTGGILLLFLWVMILFSTSDDVEAKKIAIITMLLMLGIAIFINICIAIFTIPYKFVNKKIEKSAIRKADKEYKKEKITDIDKSKYEGYYRDILALNSPLIVSYIDDFELLETDLIAELFHLKMHGIIDISDDRITLLKEEVQGEVNKYIVDCIKQHGKLIVNKEIIEKKIAVDTFNLGLVELSGVNYEKINYKAEKLGKFAAISICIALFIIFLMIVLAFDIKENNFLTEIVFPVIIVIALMFVATYHNSYQTRSISIHENLPFKRTRKGEEINEKIEGLKNYIADYSMLDRRTLDEIELWEDYLVYSVLWKQNKHAIEEYKKYIKFEEEEEENV